MNIQQIHKPAFLLADKITLLAGNHLPQTIVAIVLLMLYLLEALSRPAMPFLLELQQNTFYKQLSGFLLFGYVCLQWRLAWLRMSGRSCRANRELNLHMWLGALTPAIIFFHSLQFGTGYQILLVSLFLFNVAVGLCSPRVVKIPNHSYVVLWMVVHVGVAVLVPMVLMYHLYVIYFYD